MELTLLRLNIQFVLQEALKNLTHMLLMLSGGPGEDQNVIQLDKNKAVNHVTEDVIYQGLEHSGALVSPNGMTRYSKCPRGVLNAVFHSSPLRIQTRWYALRRSSLVKMTNPWREAKAELIRGNGYLFLNGNVV